MTPAREARIARAIDSWDRPSEMPRPVAWLVAFMTGLWAFGLEGQPPRAPDRPVQLATHFPTLEVWKEGVDDVIDVDRHKVLKGALMGWLTSGHELDEAQALEVGVPSNEWMVRLLPQLWPTLDQLAPAVAVHFAYALIATSGESAAKQAIGRLVPGAQLLEETFEGEAGTVRLLVWLRGVAVQSPVLALKIGAEALVRHGYEHHPALKARAQAR